MKFSICIPNYNYGQYIGNTIQSVLNQNFDDFQVLISDNNSIDNSWEVIQSYASKDIRINAWKNLTNIGFSGNLDKVSNNAEGNFKILVSSDDLMNDGALKFYSNFIDHIKDKDIIFGSSCLRIDSEGNPIGYDGPKQKIWYNSDIDLVLSEKFNVNIYKVNSIELLKRCISNFYGAFNFVSTCYNANDYFNVGGYGGSRLYNPDKWLHWRLLANTKFAYFIDKPLFSYRWHENNQAFSQKETGFLKYFVDEYTNSYELTQLLVKINNYSSKQVQDLFILNVIHKNVLSQIKKGDLLMAKRIFKFGWFTYPYSMKKSSYTAIIYLLLISNKLGVLVVRLFLKKIAH